MKEVVAAWLPPVIILHPYPDERFGVITQGKSRMS
jgi:hypothetical protein